MSEIYDDDRKTAAVMLGLDTVVPVAMSIHWDREAGQAVFALAPHNIDGSLAQALIIGAEAGIRVTTSEQMKWFAMGAVAQAIASSRVREAE